MPGPVSHLIFYQQLLKALPKEITDFWKGYEDYSIFAQGHDLLIYHNFYKIYSQKQLKENIELSKALQEFKFQEFVYRFLKTAEEQGVLNLPQVRIFLEAGYIGHHILDAYTHPLIIYFAGDHVRDPRRRTWTHGIAENLIDIFIMKQMQGIELKEYPIYQKFRFPCNMDFGLRKVLDDCMEKTYGFSNVGSIMEEACKQVEQFMHIFKYDFYGKKRVIFDLVDPLLKGTASFSYHREEDAVEMFINRQHEEWVNPMNGELKSTESFMDLFEKALEECVNIIYQLERLCIRGVIQRDEVDFIVPDIASTHGLSCGKSLEIKYTKEN